MSSLSWRVKMKKVNKQCSLDTPRTVRVSEKTFASEKISRICENKISVESVQMILKLDIWN